MDSITNLYFSTRLSHLVRESPSTQCLVDKPSMVFFIFYLACSEVCWGTIIDIVDFVGPIAELGVPGPPTLLEDCETVARLLCPSLRWQ